MYQHAVKSSNLDEVAYDPQSHTLRVRFKGSGATYEYSDVPSQAYLDLIQAESKGKHFHKEIRGKYEHRKLEPERA